MNITNDLKSKTTQKGFSINDVVGRKLCVGCGACSVVNDNVKIIRNEYGVMTAQIEAVDTSPGSLADLVCPFSDSSQNEDAIAKQIYGSFNKHDSRVGYYLSHYYGRRVDNNDLLNSSSGGLTSFVASELLRRNLVDGIIHVANEDSEQNNALFKFAASYSESEANKHKKSQYYSLSFDEIIKLIRGDGKRYVFVGVPCFIKALRNVCLYDAVLKEQIQFTLGLVCGHLKSSAFAELLSWQLGVKPNDIKSVDFRKKNQDTPVNAYDFMVTDVTNKIHFKTSNKLSGGNWGHATFQLKACDYCDDIFAETADAVFGDAWLPQFSSCWQGTNIILVRNNAINEILLSAKSNDQIILDNLSLDDLCKSQQGNFRHRREGLVVRLNDDVNAGKKIPAKRVDLIDVEKISTHRKNIVRLRKEMAKKSHEFFYFAKQKGDLSLYLNSIYPLTIKMNGLYKTSLLKKIARKLRNVFS